MDGVPITKRGKGMNIEFERKQIRKKVVIVTFNPPPQIHSRRPVQQA